MTGDASAAVLRGALDYLLNCAWQAPLVALAALVLTKVARLSLRGRCLAFAGALLLVGVAPLVPVHLLASPGVAVTRTASPSTVSAMGAPVSALLAGGLVLGAGLIVAIATIRLAAGWLAARRLVRRSAPVRLPFAATRAMEDFLARDGVAAPPVRACADVAGPAVVGARAPVVLVPPGFERLPEEQLVAALLHECAHVARRDYALNLVCEALALPSSWHPAAAALKRRYRAAREAACDQLAAAALGSPARYARCLVELARTVEGGGHRLSGPALPLIGRGDLEDRVRRLTRPTEGPVRLHPLQTAAAVALALGCIAPLTCLHLTPVLRGAEATREVARVAVFGLRQPAPLPPSPLASLAPRKAVSARWKGAARRVGFPHPRARAAVRLAMATPTPDRITPLTTAGTVLVRPELALARLDEAADVGRLVFAVEIGAVSSCLAPPPAEAAASHAPTDAPAPAAADTSDFDPFAPAPPAATAPAAPASPPTARPQTAGCLKSAALDRVRVHGLA